jgi:hypothetical protein
MKLNTITQPTRAGEALKPSLLIKNVTANTTAVKVISELGER